MEFVIGVILIVVFQFVGNVLCSFGVIMPLIVVRTALPLTKHLKNKNLINANGANKQSAFSICLWISIDIAAGVLLYLFGNIYVWGGFAFGFIFAFIIGIGQTGPTVEANIKDYVKSYHHYFDTVRVMDTLDAIEEYAVSRDRNGWY